MTRAAQLVSAERARRHAIALALVLWTCTLVSTFGTSSVRSLAGPLKAPDFVQFYTLGHLARAGQIAEAYDPGTFHAAQALLVPESAGDIYPPVYPPQAALLFMPFDHLAYGTAAVIWTSISIALYAVVVWRAWIPASAFLSDRTLVFAAAAGFPPFWQCVVYGQAGVLILAICFGAWIALRRQHSFAAGCVLGLLAIKPQFALPFAAVVVARRDWAMLGGAAVAVAAQAVLVWVLLGTNAFSGYASMLPVILRHADLLEAKPFQSHSLRALTRLLPNPVGMIAWGVAVAALLWRTGRAWRTDAPLEIRFGLVLLAAVLLNPHLLVYDATLLVLPLLWFGAWYARSGDADQARRYGLLTYGLVVMLLAPTAAVIKVQVSVLLMLWLFWQIDRRIHQIACAIQESVRDQFSRDAVAGVA